MSTALLLAEPEPEAGGHLERQLTDAGFAVHGAAAVAEALTVAEHARPDVVLLEHELGDVPGVELVRLLREGEPGRSWDRDVPVIVLGRITRHVSVDGERVPLAGKEFALLATLAAEPDRVFTKEELLRDVWSFQAKARTRTLDSHASRVRRKLAHGSGGPFVVNVWGVGYRLMDEPLH